MSDEGAPGGSGGLVGWSRKEMRTNCGNNCRENEENQEMRNFIFIYLPNNCRSGLAMS